MMNYTYIYVSNPPSTTTAPTTALSKLDHTASEAGKRPFVKEYYFRTNFSVDLSNQQPNDYIPVPLFRTWCEHHELSNQAPAECSNANDVKDSTQKRTESGGKRATHDPVRETRISTRIYDPRTN